MSTRTEQLAELQAELIELKAARAAALSGKSSVSVDGMSVTNWRMADIRAEITRCEKSIQRLTRGGRGMPIDMSIGQPNANGLYGEADTDG